LIAALFADTSRIPMPFVNIKIYEGFGESRKKEIASKVTEAICAVTSLPREAVGS
jgi:phenylpyruvate tautomerase PptA (4-oxalocrotonate tautomerase family)